jgi:hypothetical protein
MNQVPVGINLGQLADLLGMLGGPGGPNGPNGLQNPHADIIDRLDGKTFHFGILTAKNRDDSLTFYRIGIPGEPVGIGARLTSRHDNGRVRQFHVQNVDFIPARPGSPRRVLVSFDMHVDEEWRTYELSFVLGANDTISGTTKMITPLGARTFNLTGCLVIPEDLPNPPRPVAPVAPAPVPVAPAPAVPVAHVAPVAPPPVIRANIPN